MAIADTVDEIIDSARTLAEQSVNSSNDAAALATEAAGTLVAPTLAITIDPITEPTQAAPVIDLATVYDSNYEYQTTQDELNDAFQDFLADYFPSALSAAATTWMQDSIENGGTGLEPAIEAAIYNRGRDRLINALNENTDKVSGQFASLGWYQPPGALVDQVLKAQEQRVTKECEFAADVTVEFAKMEQSNVQFAVQHSIQLQAAVFGAAANLIGVLVRAYSNAGVKAQGMTDATAEFYAQGLRYNQLLLAIEDEKVKVGTAQAGTELKQQELVTDTLNARAARLTDAALSVAKTMSSQASSALSGQNTMATLVAEETT